MKNEVNTIFDSLLEPTCVVNEELIIVYCNNTFATLVESSPRKIVRSKKKFSELIHFQQFNIFENLKEINDPSPYIEDHFKTFSGNDGKAQITIQKDKFSSEDTGQWIIYFRDVTLEERLQKKYNLQLDQKEELIVELKKAHSQLENYSKGLESLVDIRTSELKKLNTLMQALYDSLNQAFFMFGADGQCLPVYSKACIDLFETTPENLHISKILKIQNPIKFNKWLYTLFQELLPFDDLAILGPNQYAHSKDKFVTIEYYPVRNEKNEIQYVVCVGTDKTEYINAKKEIEKNKEISNKLLNIIKNKNQAKLFLKDTFNDLELLKNKIDSDFFTKNKKEELLRALHTIKGGSGSFSFIETRNFCHELESKIINIAAEENPKVKNITSLGSLSLTNESIKDDLIKLINTLKSEKKEIEDLIDESLDFAIDINNDLYFSPISLSTEFLKETAQKISFKMKKKINAVIISGDQILLPLNYFRPFFNSLIHFIHNSIDHGIETSEERIKNNKHPNGSIEISFLMTQLKEKEFNLQCSIRDDGKGINLNQYRQKLKSLGQSEFSLSDEALLDKIFDLQVSTKESANEYSGRGIGLSSIHNIIQKMNGNLKVKSEVNKYTEFVISIPVPEKYLPFYSTFIPTYIEVTSPKEQNRTKKVA